MDISLSDMVAMDALQRSFDSAARRRRKSEKLLKPVHPNTGIAVIYRRQMLALIDQMNDSLVFWLRAAYRKVPPRIAQDEPSTEAMRRALRALAKRWLSEFGTLATNLASYFARTVQNRSDAALKKMLKDAGWTVEFKPTLAQRDVLQAVINENVSLIRSIPQQHLDKVEGIVMRSVQAGHDLAALSKSLQVEFKVPRKRADLIARDQTRKATAMLSRARQIEVGLTEAVWVHSSAGKHPRPTHVKAGRDKVRYDIREGWLDPAIGKRIWPGTEINCRCAARPVVKGFS